MENWLKRLHPNKNKTLLIFSALALLSTLLAGCGTQATASAAQPVKTATVQLQDFKGDVSLTGVIDSQDKATLSAQLGGKVVAVNAKEGTPVKKGQVIISLDKSDLLNQLAQAQSGLVGSQAQVEQARVNYENAEANFERLQQLYQSGAVSKQQLDQAQTQRDTLKSQYDAAQSAGVSSAAQKIDSINLNLAKMDIISPIDGILANCSVSVGDIIAPGVPLGTVVATNPLVLTGNISEGVVNSLKIGDSVEVSADSVPNQKFKGQISYISPVSIQTGQFFPIKVTIDNSAGALKAGMSATAKISVQASSVLAVPNKAVFQRDGHNYIYVVKNGKAIKTPVQCGLQSDTETVILKGLQSGDTIVVDGVDQLADGSSVK